MQTKFLSTILAPTLLILSISPTTSAGLKIPHEIYKKLFDAVVVHVIEQKEVEIQIWNNGQKAGMPANEKRKENQTLLYQSYVMYQSKIMPIEGNYSKYWNKNDRFKKVLEESINVLPEMIVTNLEMATQIDPEGESDYCMISADGVIDATSVDVIQSTDERVMVKTTSFRLPTLYASLHKDDRYDDSEEEEGEF